MHPEERRTQMEGSGAVRLGATGRWASVLCLAAYVLLAVSMFLPGEPAVGPPGALAMLLAIVAIGLTFPGAATEGTGPRTLRRAIALSAAVLIPLSILTPPGMIFGGSVIVAVFVAPGFVLVALHAGVRPFWAGLLPLIPPVLCLLAGPIFFIHAQGGGN